MQFFLDEDPDIGIDALFGDAEEQWELSDLSDSGTSRLPDSIFARRDIHTVDGTFVVQMLSLLDISQSAYDQHQDLQSRELDVGIENPEFTQPTQQRQRPQPKIKTWLVMVAFEYILALSTAKLCETNTESELSVYAIEGTAYYDWN